MSEILVGISVRWRNGTTIAHYTIGATQNYQWDADTPIVDRERQTLFYGFTFKSNVKPMPPEMLR